MSVDGMMGQLAIVFVQWITNLFSECWEME